MSVKKLIALTLVLMMLTGCGIMPKFTSEGDKVSRSKSDIELIQEDESGARLVTRAEGGIGGFTHSTRTETNTDGSIVKTVDITLSEGKPVVQKGGWSFGILFSLGFWWIPILIVFGLLCYFCWPLVFKLILMVGEGLGKAFSPQTFQSVVRSVQKGRERIKQDFGNETLRVFDDELSKDQDDKVKNRISKEKAKMKKGKTLSAS